MTLIPNIIDQCDVKHIMLPIKTSTLVLKVLTYIITSIPPILVT